jgi:hypothetical protein
MTRKYRNLCPLRKPLEDGCLNEQDKEMNAKFFEQYFLSAWAHRRKIPMNLVCGHTP